MISPTHRPLPDNTQPFNGYDGMRTYNPNKRAAADRRLRPQGHRKRLRIGLGNGEIICRSIVRSIWRESRSETVLQVLLTYPMVLSPSWEANCFAAGQEIPRISRNSKVHYRTHKRPPPVSILGQPNPVHLPTSHLLEIHPNIIHTSTPRVLEALRGEKLWILLHAQSTPPMLSTPAIIYSDNISRTMNVKATLWGFSLSADNHTNVEWENVIINFVIKITTNHSRF